MQLSFTGLPSGSETTFVFATPLLAAVARHQFTTARLNEGALTWQRPEIFHLDAWAAAVWQEVRFSTADVPALLSPSQETLLWRTIIQEHAPSLFDADATARLARQAATAIAQWLIPLGDDAWAGHQDAQAFLEWWRTLRSRCRDGGWITRPDLWRLLPQWLERGWWKPGPIAFLGFEKLPPGIERLRASLPRVRVFGFAENRAPQTKTQVSACDDVCEEIEFAARWSRRQFELRPDASIGVFIPDLARQAHLVRRTFDDVFYPDSTLDFASHPTIDSAFHIENTDALLNYPIAASAYLLLDLGKAEIEQQSASAILRCPFIRGAEAERSVRAQADLQLRRDRELEVPLKTLQWTARHCPVLEKSFQKVARLMHDARPMQRVGAWAQFIADLLEAVGWPGDAELSADELQIVQSWKDALSELGTLGLLAGPMRYGQVLELLRRVLAANSGPAQGTFGSPVQVLDARGARGLRFDAAVLTGLGDENWPPPIRVSPLIPLRLQIQQEVPGAGTTGFEQESHFATAALFSAAASMTGTFHGALSPLTRPYIEVGETLVGWMGRLPLDSFERGDIRISADTDAPPFQILETPVAGGTGILKSQSNCPFQAFAKYRLGAREMRDASFGYDPLDRGNFVHRSLQNVWQKLESQARLLAIDSTALRELVNQSVANALQHEDSEGAFASQSRIAEQQRVTNLILEWLDVDRSRKIPFEVEQLETEMQFNAAGLPISIRMDRIDTLADNRVVLIDYKTGKPSQNHLNCPRPKEPQLLIYAAASASKVAGVYFGKVKAGESQLVGFGTEKNKNSQWDGRRAAEARDEVDRLARDFLAGRAAVHPLQGACAYCELDAICRVNEQPGIHKEDCD